MNVNHNMIDMHYVSIPFRGNRAEFSMEVTLWHVRGLFELYPTKMAAEVAARTNFPKDEMAVNYGRLSYVRFVQED